MKLAINYLVVPLVICMEIFGIQCNSSKAQQGISNTSIDEFQCMPCGQECDKEVFTAGGQCAGCKMQLVKKSTIRIKTIQPSDICNYINDHPNVVLLDVRTKEEFDGKANPNFGTLKNAINIPIQELESRLSSLNYLKQKEVIVYCSHSHRSPRAGYMLTQNGFTNVTNLAGGLSELNDNSCKK